MKMGNRRYFSLLIAWFFVLGVPWVRSVDISFNNEGDGFFVKSSYDKYHPADPSLQKETFIVTNPSDNQKLLAQYGPFEVSESIPSELLDTMYAYNRTRNLDMHQQVLLNMDVSAHLVSNEITLDTPSVQVLIHAVPILKKGRSPTFLDFYRKSKKWCGQVYAHHRDRLISDVCLIGESDACSVTLDLPSEWWESNNTLVEIYYSFSRVEQNSKCASASNSIIPGRSFTNQHSNPKQFLASVDLLPKVSGYSERRLKNLLIYPPSDMFYGGSQFQVPVKLDIDSSYREFDLKVQVKSGSGLKITGIVSEPDSSWDFRISMDEKQRKATVTAYLRDKREIPSDRIQDLFEWQFIVDDTLSGRETGLIDWRITNKKNNKERDLYISQRSRLTTNINLFGKKVVKIMPILKINEVINMAILTGEVQKYPLWIFSVQNDGVIHDVTEVTACGSTERNVVQVSRNCSFIYFDGTESQGSHDVKLVAKSGTHTTIFYLEVWIPDDYLHVELSDSKLSNIRGWKVPSYTPRDRRNAYGLLTHSMQGDASDKYFDKKSRKCQLNTQQALVDVYTRFYVGPPSSKEYFRSKYAWFRVTDMLQDRLHVADPRVAEVHGRVVYPINTGRTSVQVLSPRGGILGSSRVHIGSDKVVVSGLLISLVTGVTLEVQSSDDIPGLLTVIAHIKNKFQGKYQEGVMEVSVQYSDGTRMPLRYINSDYYSLNVTTMNHNIAEVAPFVTPYQPRIVAVGQGRGKLLKVVLNLGSRCMKKKSNELAVTFMSINSDFSQEANYLEHYQKDAHYVNQPSGRWDTGSKFDLVYKIDASSKSGAKSKQRPNGTGSKKANDVDGSEIKEKTVQKEGQPHTEAQQQHIDPKSGSTPLEIGLYVLVSVFSVAIVVFMVNCVVFMVRYQRKRRPKVVKENVYSANDWVWIGRATLERNRMNTHTQSALMPDEDFNGNHMTVIPTSHSDLHNNSVIDDSISANNSNRHSVSTYKGSECSIRITSNPILEASETSSNQLPQQIEDWDYEAMGMTYDQLMEYFANLKESTA